MSKLALEFTAKVVRVPLSTSTATTTPVAHSDAVSAIRVVSLFIVVASAVTVKFQTSTGPVDITGAMSFAANGGIALPINSTGWFQTLAGDDLKMVLGSGVAIAGSLSYVLVNPTANP